MTKTIMDRIDTHTGVSKDKLVLNPPFPDAIKIEITGRCNYNCSFCAQKSSLREIGDIDRNFLYRILWEAKSIGVKEIGMFLLGESFLVKELAEYIKYAKEVVGIEYVFITTNGSMCSPERMIPIIDAGLDSIKFSINAGTREKYKEIHSCDRFDHVVSNVKWLSNYKKENNIDHLRTCVSSIMIPDDKEELEAFKKDMEQYVDDVYFLPLYNQAGHIGGDEYTKIIGNPGRAESMVDPIPCWALFNASKITWNGWLTACCFDHDEKFEIADLNKVSLTEAWNNEKFVNMRREHLENTLSNKSLCGKCLGIE
jgi:MoaA/NifB/PqqE/SkfB family radical SAM enzyme